MNEAEKGSSNLTFDHAELLARVDNDRELLHDLLTIFKEEFPRHLKALREAVESGDGKLVTVAAHTLKGMLLNLAAGQAAAPAGRLEQLGRSGETAGFLDAPARVAAPAPRPFAQLHPPASQVLR